MEAQCKCGCKEIEFLGIQKGLKFDLVLYNCLNPECETTFSLKRIYKDVVSK